MRAWQLIAEWVLGVCYPLLVLATIAAWLVFCLRVIWWEFG